jgi:hypothetical protein
MRKAGDFQQYTEITEITEITELTKLTEITSYEPTSELFPDPVSAPKI